jgi:regulation of enolase protein 1 (concanavalin A-like superfamily)
LAAALEFAPTFTDNCQEEVEAVLQSTVSTQGDDPAECGYYNYTITRKWTATDACGNESGAYVQVVTVRDTEAPVPPTPPADTTVACAADLPALVSLTAIDNCTGEITAEGEETDNEGAGCANDPLIITRTWAFTDACGNSSSVTQTITVVDDIAPAVPTSPADTTVACLDEVPPGISLTAIDNCTGEITAQGVDTDNGGAGCADNPLIITRTWTFADACGNSSSVTQTITVVDDVAPVIACVPSLTVDMDPGECTWESQAADLVPTFADDNCGMVSVGWEVEFPGSPMQVIAEWNFEDSLKRVAPHLPYTADAGTAANANSAPLTLVGAALTTGGSAPWVAGSGGGGTFAVNSNTWTNPNPKYWQVVIDATGYGNLSVSSKQQSSNTGPRNFAVEYSLDGSAWSAVPGSTIATANNFVSGVLNPTAIPNAADNQAAVYLRWLQTDNVAVNGGTVAAAGTNRIDDIVIMGQLIGNTILGTNDASGTAFPVGASTVTYTATDACGNTASCSFTVTVEDNEPPLITCPTGVMNLPLNADCEAVVPDYSALVTISDNCFADSLVQTPAPGTVVSGVGNQTISFVVTDVNGNSSSCNFTVAAVDVTPPTLVCKTTTIFLDPQGQYTLQDTEVLDFENSFDNCSAITVTDISPADFNCDNLGETILVSVVALDSSGNVDSCTAIITVLEGNTLPEPWKPTDVGNPGSGNTYQFSPCSKPTVFTIGAGAANNSLPEDNVAFINQNVCGDFQLTAKIEAVTPNSWAGLLVRESADPGSKMIGLYSNRGSITRFESRAVTGANKTVNLFSSPFAFWLRIVRQGNTFFSYYSFNGINFNLVNIVTIPMEGCLDIGVAAFSSIPGQVATAVFSNVSVIVPPAIAPIQGNSGNTMAPADEANEQMNVRLFPNPAREMVTIDLGVDPDALNNGETTVFRLRNELGQIIEQRRIDSQATRLEWNIGGLPAGMYFMEVHRQQYGMQVLRFVKAD